MRKIKKKSIKNLRRVMNFKHRLVRLNRKRSLQNGNKQSNG
ncbi:hypothetical protein [Psittacicella hinzii]|nr:hypothetical protein [Psittacicella hinzii]